jgi:hypothetical protein
MAGRGGGAEESELEAGGDDLLLRMGAGRYCILEVREAEAQPLAERNARLPAKQGARASDIGTPARGVIDG